LKRILKYDHTEARCYFLKEESYFNFDLPQYFVFQTVLEKVSKKVKGRSLSDFITVTLIQIQVEAFINGMTGK
jgi:RNA-directed DNA polymerase